PPAHGSYPQVVHEGAERLAALLRGALSRGARRRDSSAAAAAGSAAPVPRPLSRTRGSREEIGQVDPQRVAEVREGAEGGCAHLHGLRGPAPTRDQRPQVPRPPAPQHGSAEGRAAGSTTTGSEPMRGGTGWGTMGAMTTAQEEPEE